MRTPKALLVVALVSLIGLLLPACGDTDSTNPNANPNQKIKVAIITNNVHTFWKYTQAGGQDAAKELGVDFEFKMPPNGTRQEQDKYIEDLKAQGYQAIAISPKQIGAQKEFFKEVNKEIPLVLIDSDVTGDNPADFKARECYLGTDNVKAGMAAADLLMEALPEGGKFAVFVGSLDVTNAQERRHGLVTRLAGGEDKCKPQLERLKNNDYSTPIPFGKYQLVATRTDEGDKVKCQREAVVILQQNPNDLKAMVGLWEYNPPAMINAVKAEKRNEVIIIGFDENNVTLQTIKEGKFQGEPMKVPGTVVQMPYQFGRLAVYVMVSLVKGDESIMTAAKLNELMPKDKKGFVEAGPHKRFFLRHRSYVKVEDVKGRKNVFPVEELQKELKGYLETIGE